MRIEVRTCVHCGETKEIPQPTKKNHSCNICLDCSRQRAREYARNKATEKGQREGVFGRYPYPLEGKWEYSTQKFNAMAKKMKYMLNREEWIEQIRINLDETLNNPLVMEWIKSAKDDEKPKKRQQKIERDYPDTRGMTWDEYTAGLGDEDVDS
jgi:hypothetical protein